MRHVVESALLTQGLSPLTKEEIVQVWDSHDRNIVWLSKGEIVHGSVDELLSWKEEQDLIGRVNYKTLPEAIKSKQSAALTASGAMAVALMENIPLVVSAGIGGIDVHRANPLGEDLFALWEMDVLLLCCGPKDMMDRSATFLWLQEHRVPFWGIGRSTSTGYIFQREPIWVPLLEKGRAIPSSRGLLLAEVEEEKKLVDDNLLQKAIKAGVEAEKRGKMYHPAINTVLSEQTNGVSAMLQLEALCKNHKRAKTLSIDVIY